MKWFFTDFDGTLRNSRTHENEINLNDLEFVKTLQKNGHKLIVATGRPYSSIKKYIEAQYQLHPDFYICNAGATINNQKDDVLYTHEFYKKDQDLITEKLIEMEKEITSIIYATSTEEKMLFDKEWNFEKEKLFIDMTPQNNEINILHDKKLICFKILCEKPVWNKIVEWLESQNLRVNLTTNNVKGLTFSEIHPEGINKGNAIRILQSQFNFKDSDVIVAGDDNNDISMFEEFFDNSYIIEQAYNADIQKYAKNIIQQISEIAVNRNE
ncbi:Cof-type HAD-IIB family hydrolase [Mesoplasma syrphidae]|uniref:Cof-type HAD-IIB family hydrolase n=1 Tax=Mesoplasma syrphidae TaxID=225999 RepID=A0A2K9BL19_9MOLU|nr:HAD-IIB family hydrolase [Mesoplasma syrphidae]AUF83911.1 Cof-type HAD-IIB family hydrolase [Mesoplasma syrphidae]